MAIVGAIVCWALTAACARTEALVGFTNVLYALALAWTYVAVWSVAAVRSADRRRTWFKATALGFALVLMAAVFDSVAAAKIVDYRRFIEAVRGSEGPDVDFIDDPTLLYRRMPNAHWTGRPLTDMSSYFNLPFRTERPIVFSTDANGFRNPRALDRADIALIGDSYIEGWGVSDDETAAAQASRRTSAAVANLGTAGYGSLQELRVLERYALPLNPRLVAWFFFEGNDLDDDQNFENAMLADSDEPIARPPAEPLAHRWRDFVNRSFTWNAFLQLRQLTDTVVPNRINTFGWFRDAKGVTHQIFFYDFYATRELGDFERARLRSTEATLRKAADECRGRGVDFVVYFIPMKFRVYRDFCTFPPRSPCPSWRPWDIETEMRQLCTRAGIPFVSLTDPMRRVAGEGALLYQPTDSHWNADGQAFAADQVAARWASIAGGTLKLLIQ